MLTKSDSKTIAAVARLIKSPDGAEFLRFLESELDAVRDLLIDAADEQKCLRLQGRGKALKEIIEFAAEAVKIENRK